MLCPSYRPLFDYANNTWHRIHTMTLLTMQCRPKNRLVTSLTPFRSSALFGLDPANTAI